MSSALRTKILIALALVIGGYVLFGPGDSDTVEPPKKDESMTSAPAARPSASHTQGATRAQSAMQMLYQLAHRVSDEASAGSLFASHSWYIPPPPPPPVVEEKVAPAPPPAPTAPPMPYQYMGTYTPDGARPVFFLTHADRVYDVHIGDTLDDTYKVESFKDGQLVITYIPLNIQQTLTAGGSQ